MLRLRNQNDMKLEETIETLIDEMKTYEGNSDSYAAMVDQLTKLYAIKNTNRISKENWLTAATHLTGIALIVEFERVGIVTSKAMAFLTKMR